MTALSVIYDYEDAVQSTTSTTYVGASCTTVAIPSGEHFVIARGSSGADTNSRRTFLQALYGATQFAEGGGEAGTPASSLVPYSGPQCLGFNKVTGDGSSTLKFEFKTNAGTGRASSMILVAIPLASLRDGIDYHHSCTTSAAEVVSDAGTGSWSDVLSVTWDFGASSQDWTTFGSFEVDFDAFTAGRTHGARMELDGGGVAWPDFILNKEGENAADIYSAAFVTTDPLSGSHGIKLQVISGGTAEVDARRPNLFSLRMPALSAYQNSNYESTRVITTSATYSDLGQLNQTVSTPLPATPYVCIWSGNQGQSSGVTVAVSQLRNVTAGTNHCVDAGEASNNGNDDLPWLLVHVAPSLSGSTEFRAQIRSHDGVAGARWPSNSNERIQSLVFAAAVPAVFDPILMGSVF